jgi:hypothetical protein
MGQMTKLSNSVLLKATLKALYDVSGRRTSEKFANDTIISTIDSLKSKYDFLKYVKINEETYPKHSIKIDVSSEIDLVIPSDFGKAIESIIRVVYTDLNTEAGLYFITELKEYAGERVTSEIISRDVDLDQVQIEQHHLYQRREKATSTGDQTADGDITKKKKINLLGYTWSNVSSWKHEPGTNYCVLYSKEGKVLDRLNLDRIIQKYVEKLSGHSEIEPNDYEKDIGILEKDYELLELMYTRDMDIESAAKLLSISEDEINEIIRKLTRTEMVQFTSSDTVELTKEGINYLEKNEKVKNR